MSDTPAGPALTSHPGWQGILDEGERILWQGQPDARPRVEGFDLKRALPGLFMVGFALFWMWGAAQASVMFALFGVIFLIIGLRQVVEPVLLPAFIRSRSWYTLTDRRAIVATDIPFQGRRLVSYPIDHATPLEYVASEPPSILFGPPARDPAKRAGFKFIPDADRVMALMRQIQRGDSADPKDSPS